METEAGKKERRSIKDKARSDKLKGNRKVEKRDKAKNPFGDPKDPKSKEKQKEHRRKQVEEGRAGLPGAGRATRIPSKKDKSKRRKQKHKQDYRQAFDMNLRSHVIKLAYDQPNLRPVLLPLLQKHAAAGNPFVPPRWMAAAVDKGDLPPKVLLVWKYVVDKLGERFHFGAATKYWRNKCRKEGIDIGQFAEGGGGKGYSKSFPIKDADQIEKWVRAKMASEGLIQEVGQAVAETKMVASSLTRRIQECNAKIEKHLAGIAAGSRVQQRKKWLEAARKELAQLQGELDTTVQEVEKVETQVARVESAVPSLDFEKAFQGLLKDALKTMSKQEIMSRVMQNMVAFERGLQAEQQGMGARQAAAGDLLGKAWKAITSLAKAFGAWVKRITGLGNSMKSLMDKAQVR